MDKLQIVYPYYDNPEMLAKQLKNWESWPDALIERVSFILVDDGSPNHPAEPIVVDANVYLDLYRIKENIPWNQNGAHNLGMHVAKEGWCLSTDIDHMIVSSQLEEIFKLKEDPSKFYTFGRRQIRDLENEKYKRHPNSWLLTREMYWEAGGYDEDFSGYYGSDSVFRRALKSVGKKVELDIYLVVYDEHDVSDANTREFGRKDSIYYSPNYPHLAKKRAHHSKAESPLRFHWEQVI